MATVISKTHKDRVLAGTGTPESSWQNWARLGALPEVKPAELVPPGARAVVVAPHPDDEVLGTGGLLAHLSALGRKVLIVAVTDGTASHPDSPAWPVERLAAVRPQETREALRNLIENAIRHTPPGTEIKVTVGPAGSIVVEDNGPGVTAEAIPDLLQPFKKGSTSNEGAGLGLAIVKQAVELHHGHIEVGRSISGGAKFSLTFPQYQPAAA